MRIQVTAVATLFYATSFLMSGCAAPGTQRVAVSDSAVKAEERKQMEIVAEEVIAEQIRLADMSWLLQTRGRAICRDDVRPLLGIRVTAKPKGVMGDIYAEKFGVKEGATIFHVVAGSPADSGGIKKGDVVIKINDRNVELEKSLEDMVGVWEQGKAVQVIVDRQGKLVTAALAPVVGCRYGVGLSPEQIINAFADGTSVWIARGMMSFAKSDNELALVVRFSKNITD